MARRAFFALAALCCLLATAAEAASPTDTLRATFAEANQIISDPATEDRPLDRLVSIRALFSRVFDFRGAAERVLGPEWKARTPVEQREFTAVFANFVERGFVYWLASVAEVDSDGGGITVLYLGEATNRDRAAVRTVLVGRGGRQIRLDHEMVLLANRWLVRDIRIEGVSLLTNYRAQFERVIRSSSYRELLARIQERAAAELPRPAAAPVEPPLGAELKVPLYLYETR